MIHDSKIKIYREQNQEEDITIMATKEDSCEMWFSRLREKELLIAQLPPEDSFIWFSMYLSGVVNDERF